MSEPSIGTRPKHSSRTGRIRITAVTWLWTGALAVAITGLINARMAAPLGFADEFTYAVLSSHFGRESALVDNQLVVTIDAPNRVFLALYGLLGSQPRPIFEMARALNSILLGVGISVLFLAAREGKALGPSLVVAIAYGLGPQSTYTAYFTPETMYAVVFFLQTTLAALALSREDARLAILAGASAAALSLVKPHGLPVGAVTFMFMVAYAALHRGSGARSLWVSCLAYVVATIASGLVVGRVLAPDVVVGNALTGSFYARFPGEMAATLGDPAHYAAIGRMMVAHVAVTACLAGPALVAGLSQIPGRPPRAESGAATFASALAGLTAWLLMALIVMTAVFTVAVEETNRLHLRYYAFCIPLLFIGLAACEASGIWTRRQQLLGLGAWLMGILLYVLFVQGFLRSPFDAPEFLFRPWVVPGVPLAGALIALLAYRKGSRILLRTVLGAYLVISVLAIVFDRQFQLRVRDSAEDRAARVAAALADEATAPMLIVAPKEDRFGLPYVYRIASLVTHRADFLGVGSDEGRPPRRLAPGTVLVGKRESLAAIGVSPMVEIADFGVAQIGENGAAVHRPPTAAPQPR